MILGKDQYKKCPNCDLEGTEYWDENGQGVSPYPRPEWGEKYDSGDCENCGGLAYVKIPLVK
jgi:hypothetical protein